MMSGAQMWVLKNEVLEKSNTRFPAPPIKNDLKGFWEPHVSFHQILQPFAIGRSSIKSSLISLEEE